MEIDETILKVATDYFGLVQDEKLRVEIADGIEFIRDAAIKNKKFDAILFDVDSKDVSVGMSCPPKAFVDYSFLETVQSCLSSEGFFILNIVARNKLLRDEVISNLNKMYKFVASYKVSQDVNEIIFCGKNKISFDEWKNSIKKTSVYLNKQVKKHTSSKEILEISSLLENFKLAI